MPAAPPPPRHTLRREEPHLHGPRPPPLRLSKESRKIRKQQVAPPPPPPVIIYAVSPKTIHVDQNEFMSLVQRLTGPNASSSTPPPASAFQENDGGGAYPAAQLASVETQVFDGGVEMPQNLLRHATDSSSLPRMNIGVHGNMNRNNYLENNLIAPEAMNIPSPSILDLFNSFSYIEWYITLYIWTFL